MSDIHRGLRIARQTVLLSQGRQHENQHQNTDTSSCGNMFRIRIHSDCDPLRPHAPSDPIPPRLSSQTGRGSSFAFLASRSPHTRRAHSENRSASCLCCWIWMLGIFLQPLLLSVLTAETTSPPPPPIVPLACPQCSRVALFF